MNTNATGRRTHTNTRFMMKRFLRASLYCTVVSSAIMTSLRDQTPPSARKWMSVIPYFFTQIDECHHLFPPGCSGLPCSRGPSSILTSLLTLLIWRAEKERLVGGKAVTSFRTGPNKGPGACGVVFISLVN